MSEPAHSFFLQADLGWLTMESDELTGSPFFLTGELGLVDYGIR